MHYSSTANPGLLKHMLQFVSDNKRNLFSKIINNRTRHITVVLEDIYQSQNASAILRTCDCFGIQDVHIIENKNEYEINPDVALGSSKWLTLNKYNEQEQNTIATFNSLRNKGYRIIATTPHKNDNELKHLPIDSKIALVFGTELEGLSENAMENADEFVKIPMYGFTESFNVSVSAAIILHNLTERLRNSGIQWQLSEEEMIEIKLNWCRSVVKSSELIEQEFLKNL